jgi:hypothetical protein
MRGLLLDGFDAVAGVVRRIVAAVSRFAPRPWIDRCRSQSNLYVLSDGRPRKNVRSSPFPDTVVQWCVKHCS